MKLVCTLLWFIFMSSTGFGAQADSVNLAFKSCLRHSLHKNSPPDRDNAKFICLERFVGIPLDTCLNEAMKMEYLSNSQEALKSCYYSRPRIWNARRCLDVAKKLHTISERDNMRMDCFSQLESERMSRVKCLMITESFEQLHYKERFKQVCQEN